MKSHALMIKLSHLGHLWRNGRWHGLRNDINIQNQEPLWLLAGCNVWKMAQKNKLNRKVCARLCCAFFEGSSTLPVRLLLLDQQGRAAWIVEEIFSTSGKPHCISLPLFLPS